MLIQSKNRWYLVIKDASVGNYSKKPPKSKLSMILVHMRHSKNVRKGNPGALLNYIIYKSSKCVIDLVDSKML